MLVLTQNEQYPEFWEAGDSRNVAGKLIAEVIQQALNIPGIKVTTRANEINSNWIVTIITNTKPRDAAEANVRSAWEKADEVIRTHGVFCGVLGRINSESKLSITLLEERAHHAEKTLQELGTHVAALENTAENQKIINVQLCERVHALEVAREHTA